MLLLHCTLFVFRAVFSTLGLTVLSYCRPYFHFHFKLFIIGQIKMDGWISAIVGFGFAIWRYINVL